MQKALILYLAAFFMTPEFAGLTFDNLSWALECFGPVNWTVLGEDIVWHIVKGIDSQPRGLVDER